MYLQLIVCLIAVLLYRSYANRIYAFGDEAYYNYTTRKYLYIMIAILILQSGLRNVAVGSDTYGYSLDYEHVTGMSWERIFSAFPKTYIDGQGKDPGYKVVEKVVQLITTNYQFYLFLVATFFFTSLAGMFRHLKVNLEGTVVAILVYEVLYYGFFSVTGIRQTIATGIFFYAFPFLQKRKLLPYVALIVVGATIHKSLLLLLPFYFLANLKNPRKYLIWMLIALPFLFGLARAGAQYMTSFSLFESYSSYSDSTYETDGAINFTIFLVGTTILTLMSIPASEKKQTNAYRIQINALTLALLFAPLTWVDPSLMRVCQYFSVFSMFLLGPVLQKFCESHNVSFQNALLLLFLLFSAIIIKRDADYAFFWQYMALPENYHIFTI